MWRPKKIPKEGRYACDSHSSSTKPQRCTGARMHTQMKGCKQCRLCRHRLQCFLERAGSRVCTPTQLGQTLQKSPTKPTPCTATCLQPFSQCKHGAQPQLLERKPTRIEQEKQKTDTLKWLQTACTCGSNAAQDTHTRDDPSLLRATIT
eukprot:4095203-Pleurochrysis_carterae.AAC.2